jgi:DNA-binding NarL/FixJ family response regulator
VESTIRILIVDDHVLFREGLAGMLAGEPDFEVIGLSGGVDDALQQIAASTPDVVILDIDLPGRRGGELLEVLPPDCGSKVLLVTAVADAWEVAGLLKLRARGAFSKTSDCRSLAQAIRTVSSGSLYLDQFFLSALIAAVEASKTPEADDTFTDRERQILEHVCAGLGNKEIADRLMITEASVKAGLQRLFAKFNVRSRAQLVASTAARIPYHH